MSKMVQVYAKFYNHQYSKLLVSREGIRIEELYSVELVSDLLKLRFIEVCIVTNYFFRFWKNKLLYIKKSIIGYPTVNLREIVRVVKSGD